MVRVLALISYLPYWAKYSIVAPCSNFDEFNLDFHPFLHLPYVLWDNKNYRDQVTVNKTLCIERETTLAAKERALAELNAEKVTVKGWSDASEKAEPKESHLTAVKRIFRYLKGTPNLGLWYSKDSGFDLTAYSDSDFAGCKIDRKSTTGGCHLLGGKLVSWTSKKQNSVSTSTAEAEYVAAGICCAQVLWLRNQLQDYDIQLSKIPIYCDNTSAIAIANNPVLHSKTKHIEVRYHFIRDHVMNGDIELHFVPTEYQLADPFTKPLDVTRFNMLISELGMLNPDD
ncbi:hypothetical protein OSB04_029457 [Centaurea solstitialis]|uniref:Copia protein n=1 Tax=Centaurea solstitialis TaxID=347529 RepID=A0AA38SUI7_9ASTR|nr:hypothetical protein OSB04_029457 [Centaurea solstitialis]